MKSGLLTALAATVAFATLAPRADAHCQIPCGIYDNVIQAMHTDWVTVAAMKCKQSTDPKAVEPLHILLHNFEDTFGSKK